MNNFQLFAHPWWVNLLILVPIAAFFAFRKGLALSRNQLLIAGLFGVAFGFVEAACVVYLRSATNTFPGYSGNLSQNLFVIEFFRELATMVILITVSLLATKGTKERSAMFLWIFSFWDLMYYLGLWLVIRWPSSLAAPDVLFLIPVPWLSQVWFPIFVSLLSASAVIGTIY